MRPALAAAGYRAVSPYMRGYLPTEIPAQPAYDADTLGQDVLALITALGEKKAIVVGHDWGASAAYAAASLGPERVELLVTVAIPHTASLRPSLRLVWQLRHFFVLRRRHAARKLREGNLAYIMHREHPERFIKELLAVLSARPGPARPGPVRARSSRRYPHSS